MICTPPSTWGGVLRPGISIDDERRPKRALIFIGSVIVFVVLVFGSVVYFAHNLGTKTTTKKDVLSEESARKYWILFHDSDDSIQNLNCPCKKTYKARLPFLFDLMTGEEKGLAGSDLGCITSTNLYKRCVSNVPAAAAAYEAMDSATRDTCSAADPTNTLALMSCRRFATTLSADYQSVSSKVSSLSDPLEWHEEAMESYVEMCEGVLRSQVTEMNTLFDSLETMGVDEANIEAFSQNAVVAYAEAVEANITKICPWDDEALCEGQVCEGYGGWPLFSADEVTQLSSEYSSHFSDCAAPQCSYIEDEDVVDVFMKTFALSSPIFSTIMTAAVILYSCVDNHWEEREHELVEGTRHNPIGRGGDKVQNNNL